MNITYSEAKFSVDIATRILHQNRLMTCTDFLSMSIIACIEEGSRF
jgi:hypothetical protein